MPARTASGLTFPVSFFDARVIRQKVDFERMVNAKVKYEGRQKKKRAYFLTRG